MGVQKGTNPPIHPSVQAKLFEYLKEASSVTACPWANNNDVIIMGQEEIKELLNHLEFQPIEDQRDRGEGAIYCLVFSLPNGKEAAVHVCEDGWCFTGGLTRKYSKTLLEFLGEKARKAGMKEGK